MLLVRLRDAAYECGVATVWPFSSFCGASTTRSALLPASWDVAVAWKVSNVVCVVGTVTTWSLASTNGGR